MVIVGIKGHNMDEQGIDILGWLPLIIPTLLGSWWIWLIMGGSFYSFVFPAGLLSLYFIYHHFPTTFSTIENPRYLAWLAIFSLCAIGSFFALKSSIIPSVLLPGNDGVVVPNVAAWIASSNKYPWRVGVFSQQVTVYPPGTPFLLALCIPSLSATTILHFWKWMYLMALLSIPWSWSFYMSRLFFIKNPLRIGFILLSYIGFLVIDRTLLLVACFAGKNALIIALFFTPLVFYYFVKQRGVIHWVFSTLAIIGLTMIHYSAFYLLWTLFISIIVLHANIRQKLLALCSSLFIASLSVIPVVWRLRDAAFSATESKVHGLDDVGFMVSRIFSPQSPFFYIFYEQGFNWPGKTIVLYGMTMLTAGYSMYRIWQMRAYSQPNPPVNGIIRFFIFCHTALVIGIIIAAGLLPGIGINIDYVRWYSFPLIALCFILPILLGMELISRKSVPLFLLITTLLTVAGIMNIIKSEDFNKVRTQFTNERTSDYEIAQWERLLSEKFDAQVPFYLISQGRKSDDGYYTALHVKALELLPLLTKGRGQFLNGSWTTPSPAGGRTWDGYPSPRFFALLPPYPILFVTPHDIMQHYTKDACDLRDAYALEDACDLPVAIIPHHALSISGTQ